MASQRRAVVLTDPTAAPILPVPNGRKTTMSILVDSHTKVICQGMGKAGTFHATRCRAYGTRLVADLQ